MHESPLLTIHRTAGARLAAGDGPQSLLTYGDVPSEYTAAREGVALFDETERGLVSVRGEEAQAFLHRLLANDVNGLGEGEGGRNLLLSPKGKVLHDFDLLHSGDGFLLSTAPGGAAALAEALEMYHFSEAFEITDASDAHAPISIVGPGAEALLRGVLEVDLPDVDHRLTGASFEGGALALTRMPIHGSSGLRLLPAPEDAARLWRALVAAGARPAGRVVADILRVEAGAARPGDDIDDSVYPQEARLESAFSLDKGCYIGQEVVAKIDTYGGLNKRMVALAISHDDPVARGTRLYRQTEEGGEWRDLGIVTSWAYSFVLDTGLVLAYVKRRHQAPGTVFRLGDGPAEAKVVPLPVRPDAVAITGDFE